MMKDRSLARQILTIVLAAQLPCAFTLSGIAVLNEAHSRLRALDVSLQGRSDSLLGAIQDAEDANATVRIDPAELNLPAEGVFAVYNQGGSLLGGSSIAPEPLITRGQDGYRTVRFGGIRYRLLQREALRVIDRAEFGGTGLQRPVTILYAAPETHVWHEIVEAVSYSLFAIFLATGFTIAFVVMFLKRALRPITELAAAAGQVSAPALRFEAPGSVLRVRELRPLAQVLTDSLTGLREAFEREHRFVGNAAHELKTAIAVVRSSIQLLMLKRRSTDQYVAGLERVLEDNLRVEALVGKMLELARAEEKDALDSQETDFCAVVGHTLEELRPLAEEQGVTVYTDCSQDAMVRLCEERARVLISNLVLNAIQHSQAGQSVAVSVHRQPPGSVVLEVADTGAGIGAEALPHIFERFYREDRSRSRDTGGAGLGLSICKSIVEAAGGTIRATSFPKSGTTIRVVFSAA